MSEKTPKALLEALLFASTQPVDPGVLARTSGIPEGEIPALLAELAAEYEGGGRGFFLSEVGGGWQLRSRPEYAPEVARLREARPKSRFTRFAMETLAIIAYRQPILRSEIETVRGVDCGATLKSLMAQGMVKVIGRKEAPGRPILYGTTNEFLQYFSLRDLESLPTLQEVKELDEGALGGGEGFPGGEGAPPPAAPGEVPTAPELGNLAQAAEALEGLEAAIIEGAGEEEAGEAGEGTGDDGKRSD